MNKLTYNTKQKQLILPEYGRNIQNMVDYCISIPDREKRIQFSNSIIHIMGNTFPYLRDTSYFKHILWNHLAIMSNFSLDIDYPYEEIKKENTHTKPQKLLYPQSHITYKHYGRLVEEMILKISKYEESQKKERLIQLLAIYMKKSLIMWSKEEIEDSKIFEDLSQLSNKKILFDENRYTSPIQTKYVSHKISKAGEKPHQPC